LPNFYLKKLEERESEHLLRTLQMPSGADFCSNDYLSFASDPVLQKKIQTGLALASSGSTGSRLLRGHHDSNVALESSLAKFSDREESLFFPSGYQANLGLLTAVLNSQSLVFSDQLNHASIIDGIKLSGAAKKIFPHNDMAALEKLLQDNAKVAHKVVVVESLFSMKGDFAPLVEISDICLRHGAELIVDEMHATGLYGAGLSQRNNLQNKVLASVHGAGKALGVSGAWIACDAVMKDFLINFSRPFIYSTAPSPLVTTAVKIAIEHWNEVGEERALRCLEKAREFVKQIKTFLVDDMISGDGPIVYLNLKNSHVAMEWSSALQMHGFDVRAIRYPTVPEDDAGLRISIHASHASSDIKALTSAIRQMVIEC